MQVSMVEAAAEPSLAAGDKGQRTPGLAIDLAGVVVVAAIEFAALAMLMLSAQASVATVVVVHLTAIILLVLWTRVRQSSGRDLVPLALAVVATIATGPIGAPLAVVAALATAVGRRPSPLLAEWYDRIALSSAIDDTTRLADQVRVGRTMRLDSVLPPSYVTVMRNGTVAEQQVALGQIARQFQLDYLPALAIALRSPEPVIRVQAAAVATRVRPTLAAFAGRALEVAATPSAHDEVALREALATASLCAASGLLDAGERRRLTDAVARLEAVVQAGRRSRSRQGNDTLERLRAVLRLSPAALEAEEARLLAGHRYAEWRNLRRVVRVCAGQTYRLRPLPGSARRRARGAA